ncbi:MAG: Mur ligase family protein [Bacteroidota bacterium]
MNIHFIAIGGSAMHNLAIALCKKGYTVTGSDDEIFEPSRSKLKKHGLLPKKIGWDTCNIYSGLDAVILGMHARADNPELLKAQTLGIKTYSFPEYIYEQTKDKTRVVIGGSHGKTTITAMILHVLQYHNIDCDYLVGAQLEGFDIMVRLTDDATIAIIEGDEYLSSPIDRRPKFHLYKPHIALLSGIAWDHINVFPTFENYVEQFRIFIDKISEGGTLVFCQDDEEVKKMAGACRKDIKKLPYSIPAHKIKNGVTFIIPPDIEKSNIPLWVFGDHNLLNINGARLVCNQLNINNEQFYEAISSFKGASKRLELLVKSDKIAVYNDFAHSPSKVGATISALKKQNPFSKLVACLELHTFSSLSDNFLKEYRGTMEMADVAIVYYNPHTIAHKKLKPIAVEQVKEAFGRNDLLVYTDLNVLIKDLKRESSLSRGMLGIVLLFMSSGNFNGLNFMDIAAQMDPKITDFTDFNL